MSRLNFAVYAEGCMYPNTNNKQSVQQTISQLQNSGFYTAILGLFHIGRNDNEIGAYQNPGDIYFNNTLVFSDGEFVGYRGYGKDPSWPDLVASIKGGTVSTVCASIGGGGVFDYTTIAEIYHNNGNSFDKTNLEKNFRTMKTVLPDISIIDMDNEDNWTDVDSFVAFCKMLIDIGFAITFCPYTDKSFWTDSLKALNTSNPGAVKWWNLQCYDGGAPNDPATWASAITSAIPGFSTDGYILAGDWTNDTPAGVQALMSGFQKESCVGGGFIWTLDNIIEQNLSDPGKQMTAYVDAISVGLGNLL